MNDKYKGLEKLSGSVDSMIFKSEDDGYCVIMLKTDDDLITVVGYLGNVDEGESLVCYGRSVNHQRFGEQFKCEYCERSLPDSPEALKRYLASGLIDGIGPVLAKSIVDEFGSETLSVIENEPERLAKLDGISFKKAAKMSESFKKTFAARSLMIRLGEFDLPPSVAIRAWKRWKDKAEELVLRNPYVLCADGIGVSFAKADDIARQSDLPLTDGHRLAAGIAACLKEAADEGHTALPTEELCRRSCSLLGIDEELFAQALKSEIEEENVHIYCMDNKEHIMLHDFYCAEDYIARRLAIMSELSYDNKIDFSEVIDIAEEDSGISYEETQRKAINLALSKGFLVLTGGPGTGKTTTLNAILSLFEQQGMEVLLCAPTGRAAKRLSDLTGHEAKTIHRLLEVKSAEDDLLSFVHDERDPLDCDVLIIDEMSMVDSVLFESVLRAIVISCKLVLVGDSDQLPSVGAGNVLHDIIESGIMPVVTLTEIFRQAQSSSIITNAHKIVRGEHPDLAERGNDFYFMQRESFEDMQALTAALCETRLPKAYGFDPFEDIQVLSPTRKGPAGTVELNRLLQSVLNPPEKGVSEVKTQLFTFRTGDKVMQTRNNYDILWKRTDSSGKTEEGAGIFNGDIGLIRKVNKILRTLTIDFEGRIATYSADMLFDLELAYAVTVHKSQGSEFNAVILAVLGGYDKLYYRNLLYTAVTRAKKLLVIVGSRRTVEYMIDNDRRTDRCTALKHMMLEAKN